jgi:hypothetical protein
MSDTMSDMCLNSGSREWNSLYDQHGESHRHRRSQVSARRVRQPFSTIQDL